MPKLENAHQKVVTVAGKNLDSSNTYIQYEITDSDVAVYHPLSPDTIILVDEVGIDVEIGRAKCSYQRALEYAREHSESLDEQSLMDIEGLCIVFSITRHFSNRQKKILADVMGQLAVVRFDDNLRSCMEFIKKNEALLDEFNYRWYKNFTKLFSGEQRVSSKAQRMSIFNIAGSLLAEVQY